jgi:hypothetical protein
MDSTGDVIMGAQSVLVPPSPGFLNGLFEQEHRSPAPSGLAVRKAKMRLIAQDRTGAGIKKSKSKSKTTVCKLVDATAIAMAALSEEPVQKPFRFMDLPGGRSSGFENLLHLLMSSRD